jgi:hypothetical protein
MKKLLTISVIVLFQLLSADAAKPLPRQMLINRMAKIQQKGYMYGHQDDPFYGISWEWDNDRSDTYDLVGDYPGVMGFDLGGLEMGDEKNLDSVPFTRIRQEIIRQHERGGIVTISWHPRNPLLGTTAWIEKDIKAYDEAVASLKKIGREDLVSQIDNPKHTVKSLLPGGKMADKYQLWLRRITDFLVTLKDKKGNQVPVIFRPWHENNGNWFWWGQANCSDADFHALWNIMQDYINKSPLPTSPGGGEPNTLKDYIVWSYSPNLQGNWTEEKWMVRYPGDDRVDLIGEDAYQWGSEADFKAGLDADLTLITKIAKEHGKLIAMTECGYQNSPDATWWQRVFKPVIEKYPICYFLPWRNYSKEHFGASKDAKTADDFKAWAKEKNFLFVKDVKSLK